jgi:hypothetical protein
VASAIRTTSPNTKPVQAVCFAVTTESEICVDNMVHLKGAMTLLLVLGVAVDAGQSPAREAALKAVKARVAANQARWRERVMNERNKAKNAKSRELRPLLEESNDPKCAKDKRFSAACNR